MEKAVLGALGGLCAVLVKFLGQDYANVVAHAGNLSADQMLAYKIGYGVLTPILMFLGAFVAWISEERKRVKIVALAVAAPAMITTWSGGHSGWSDSMRVAALQPPPGFIQSAYADTPAPTPSGITAEDPDSISASGLFTKLRNGVAIFFGRGNAPSSYSVVVGSFQDKKDAEAYAAQVNQEDPSLHAWVGQKIPPNTYYPVVVGKRQLLGKARELRARALKTRTIQQAYFTSSDLQ
jgi:hypothetical protein